MPPKVSPPKLSKPKPVNDLALSIQAKGYSQTLLLWPHLWQKWQCPIELKWQGKPFSEQSKKFIPNEPGVYAFVIQPGIPRGLPISVLMYVGMSNRPLRERFAEYLREKSNPSGRPAICAVLQMYEGHLHFYCAKVAKPVTPKEIEDHLLETFAPPVNKQYPATIARMVGAFS